MKVSNKYIIEIDKFLINYILSEKDSRKYDGGEISTHDELNYYLFVNGYNTPDRLSFRKVKKSDILSGKTILVKDEAGKVIPYNNPKIINFSHLQNELNSSENRKEMLKNRRIILKKEGYVETKRGDIVKRELIDEQEETITHKINKNKKLANRNMHGMKGRLN